ncbi:MAG: 2,5-diamino-6-(ribosylamino)-4(3H)-pyrimidinone 5'-phosphate reductase [Anaerolineae bacterium]|nr:MAG: 2,5-diamino-6-(ribosylamino)-4(3H)-pyrimidinone 5'-phosphate reductase [Anaerolineae bacterium]
MYTCKMVLNFLERMTMTTFHARPYVIINAAMSVDGKIDTIERNGASISSEEDKRRVLELRAQVDAVMVGGNTLLKESPKLTVKLPELEKLRIANKLPANPAKIGIISNANGLNIHGNFITAGPARRIVFTTNQTSAEQVNVLQELGVEVYQIGEKRVDLQQALDTLSRLGIRTVMLEGGGTLIAEFIRLGLADELRVYIAPKIFGGSSAPTLVDGDGWTESAAKKLTLVDARVFDQTGGVLIVYRL